jgi:DNA-binding LacI/PurR family transcriptional regulator
MSITQAQLAEKLGVSQGSVSLAFRSGSNRQNAKTRAAILEAADKYGYRPNAAARAMRSSQTRQVGVLIRNAHDRPFHNPGVYEMILGVNQHLESQGYILSLVRFDDVQAPEDQVSRFFREHVLDGIIVMDVMPDSIYERIESMVPQCIWVETNVWRQENCIRRDEKQVGCLIGEKLLEMKYKRLVWYGSDGSNKDKHYSTDQRLEGLRQATDKAGIELEVLVPREWVDLLPVPPESDVLQNIFQPDCAIVTDNTDAVFLMAQAAMLGLRPGYDFGVASCDLPYAVQCAAPMVSHVSFDRFGMGQRAAQMMLNCLTSPKKRCSSVCFAGQWCPGSTTLRACEE